MKVLIVQPFGIGDLLFVTPIIRALAHSDHVNSIDCLLGSRNDVVVRNNPAIDKIFTLDKDALGAMSFFKRMKAYWDLIGQLRSRQYDAVLDFSLVDEYAFLARLAGAKKVVGFKYKKRGRFSHITESLPNGYEGKHVAAHYMDLLKHLEIEPYGKEMDFFVSEEDQKSLGGKVELKSSYIVITCGGGESWGKDAFFKRWSPKYFAEFISKFLDVHPNSDAIYIVGTSGESELGDEFENSFKELSSQGIPVVSLCGKLSLAETAALLKNARLFVGNDGGLTHIAHSLKTPLVSFYGPVDPVVYGPYPNRAEAIAIHHTNLDCWPCYKKFRYKSDCSHRDCLTKLTPDMAWEQWMTASKQNN